MPDRRTLTRADLAAAAWCPIDNAPSDTTLIVWGGGPMRFARLDGLGQWRGMTGNPMHIQPTHWMHPPPTPVEVKELRARANGETPDG